MSHKKRQPKGSAGGAAAAGGMNFQSRVAALAMAHALTDSEDYSALALDAGYEIKSIHLETCDEIDDIVLEGTYRAFIQAKKNLPLSDSPNSQLSKVIDQFVRHHLYKNKPDDRYILATSLESSSRITVDLRKITASLRLNANALDSNPSTLAEQDVIKKIEKLIEFHWLKINNLKPSKLEIIGFMRLIFILPLAIEKQGSDERLAVTMLRSKSIIDANLLWSTTVTLALSLMQNRQSIDMVGLRNALGSYIKPKGEKKTALEEYKLSITVGAISTGKEVVVLDNFEETDAICIGGFERFNKNGRRNLHFFDNFCELPDNRKYPVLYRTATVTGLQRFLQSNKNILSKKKIFSLDLIKDSAPEENLFAVSHKNLLSKIIGEKNNLFRCLVCNSPLSEDRALSVEIDESGKPLDIGLIHKNCIRPSLRVLGEIQSELFSDHPYLIDFDYEGWVLANKYGPSSLSGFPHPGAVATAGWEFSASSALRGAWCIRVNLEDGSTAYVTHRGKVERFGKEQAHKRATEFNNSYIQQRELKDPLVYTGDHSVYGTMKDIQKRFGLSKKLLKCKSAEPILFDTAIDVAYSSKTHHYAPLVVLLSKDTGEPLLIDGAIYFLNDPFLLSRFLENWVEAEKKVTNYAVEVITDDNDFDNIVVTAIKNNQLIYIDPIFNGDGEIVDAVEVVTIEEMLKRIST